MKVRLNKFISDSGYCSRREADTYIEQGRVTVNRADCTEKGTLIEPTDRIEVDGELIKVASNKIYIALNKPVGVTCTTDTEDKTNIVDFVGHRQRIFPIGRLDKQSQGLILLTNDGDIVNKVLRAGNNHQKEYLVTVDKAITEDFLKKMSSGVRLDDGVRTEPCKITREADTKFRIILTQGLNRQIRRMCNALDYNVKKLVRVRIMNITLRGIEEGKWRYLSGEEVRELMKSTENSIGTKQASPPPPKAYKSKIAPARHSHSHSDEVKGNKKSFNEYRRAGKKR